MTRADLAEEVIEALASLAIGEQVWFYTHDMFGQREALRRGVVMNIVPWQHADIVPWQHADIAVGTVRPTMPTFRVCFDDIVRDK